MASFIQTKPFTLNINRLPPKKCTVRRLQTPIKACLPVSKDVSIPIKRTEISHEAVQDAIFDEEPTTTHDPSAVEDVIDDETAEDLDDFEMEEDSSWYSIDEKIGKEDVYEMNQKSEDTGILDLAALDELGRGLAPSPAKYDSIVDIDIEEGGVLPNDDDNNELFCGVGLDALVDTQELIENLRAELGIETATHVQLAAVPRVADRRDIVIQSHTGTGKTLAFLLPMLEDIDTDFSTTQGIIIAPTRELAMQIFRETQKLVKGLDINVMSLIGGANPARQVDKMRKKVPHIVVGTPGRMAEMHQNKELRLYGARMMVVDEVDQSLTAAFAEDISYLLHHCPRKVQKVLVSATSDVDSVRGYATRHLHKPVLLRVGGRQRLPKQIEHWYCIIPARKRAEYIRKLMNTDPAPKRAIAFVDEPRRVDMLAERLYQMKVSCGTLRGDAYKTERAEVLTAFRKGRIPLLITTEVAARGLDIQDVTHVFNVDLPTDGDHYVHRAGRCGRVLNAGTVVSFATVETGFVIGRLEKQLGTKFTRMEPRGGKYVQVSMRGNEAEGIATATKGSGLMLSRREIDALVEAEEAERLERKQKKIENKKKEAKATDGAKTTRKIKVRLRDTKNKGKPKGRLGKGVIPQSENNEGGQDGDTSTRRAQRKTKQKFMPNDEPVQFTGSESRAERKLRVKAKSEGWVGNR